MDSKDLEEGYPGALNIAAKLSLSPINGELKIEYSGMSTRKTPIDISNNVLFNLAGHSKGINFLRLTSLSDLSIKFKFQYLSNKIQ